MENITHLTNLESGKCVLIGGGPSVAYFDFDSLDSTIMRMAVNRCFIETRIDYQVFGDGFFLEWLDDHPLKDARVLIGAKGNNHGRIDYYYDFLDGVSEGRHTGYHALQIAEMLGFQEIFLIGFDYHEGKKGKLHYYEGEFGTEITRQEKDGIWRLFPEWLKDFDRHKWEADIYNVNPDSKLKKFPYKEVR
jgi:hypothetical protein